MKNIKSIILELLSNRHIRFSVSLAVAIIVFSIAINSTSGISLLIVSWTSFAMIYSIFSWVVILSFHPLDVKSRASQEDTTGSFIFLFVMTAAISSLAGIFMLLKASHSISNSTPGGQVALSLGSVLSSWILVQTLFTLRYAHFYYSPIDTKADNKVTKYGLVFPEEKTPDYIDFAYFSFVVGMTFQVSDVQITTRKIRRLVLIHSCLSFLYNTIILALSINTVSALISK